MRAAIIAFGCLFIAGCDAGSTPSSNASATAYRPPALATQQPDQPVNADKVIRSLVPNAKPVNVPNQTELTAEIAAYERHPPLGAPELLECPPSPGGDNCLAAEESWVHDRTWVKAHHGDIEAAGDVAWCLADRVNCGLQPNSVQSCAWAAAIVVQGGPDVGDEQAHHLQEDCSDLEDASRTAAKLRAAQLAALPTWREPRD